MKKIIRIKKKISIVFVWILISLIVQFGAYDTFVIYNSKRIARKRKLLRLDSESN